MGLLAEEKPGPIIFTGNRVKYDERAFGVELTTVKFPFRVHRWFFSISVPMGIGFGVGKNDLWFGFKRVERYRDLPRDSQGSSLQLHQAQA